MTSREASISAFAVEKESDKTIVKSEGGGKE
jgi:hypothetical protein